MGSTLPPVGSFTNSGRALVRMRGRFGSPFSAQGALQIATPGRGPRAGYIWSIQKLSSRSATLERTDGPGPRGMSWFQ